MQTIKIILKTLKYAIPIILLVLLIFYIKAYNDKCDQYSKAVENNKAYVEYLNDFEYDNYVLNFTLDEYEYINDSLIELLHNTQDSLNIKTKELIALQRINSEYVKYDTLVISDTIFVKNLTIDTMFGDYYINHQMHLEYPNIIELNTKVISEKDVIVSTHRETIEPPKKFFLCRWFQKRHNVTKVVIVEHNPHINTQEDVYIQITD